MKTAQYGGYWKNDSTEKQFAKSNLNGLLEGNGSSRWKQRAYYDFLKDISSKITGIPLIRISIYDDYKGFTAEQLLKKKEYAQLAELINSKVNSYALPDTNYEKLPQHVIDGIQRGLDDAAAGRTITLEEFKQKLLYSSK